METLMHKNALSVICERKSVRSYTGEQATHEIDKTGWFTLDEAKKQNIKGQVSLIKEMETKLDTVK